MGHSWTDERSIRIAITATSTLIQLHLYLSANAAADDEEETGREGKLGNEWDDACGNCNGARKRVVRPLQEKDEYGGRGVQMHRGMMGTT